MSKGADGRRGMPRVVAGRWGCVTVNRPVATSTLALLVALAACAERGEVRGAGPYAREAATMVPRVEKTVGLTFKTPPTVEARSKEQVREFLVQQFKDQVADSQLVGREAAYKRLGMIPDSLNLEAFLTDLLTEQIAGFYDPHTNVLYVVQGAPKQMTSTVIAHELIHALQDQYLDLDSLERATTDNDRSSAAQAVLEGQAMLDQIEAMSGGANALSRVPGGWDRIRDAIRSDRGESMPLYASAPTFIKESLIFPYLSGAEFMRAFEDRRPGRMPYDSMPTSTEQILHPDAYFGAQRDEPTRIVLPRPRGASVRYADDLGEFETRLFLYQHLRDQNTAVRAAAGWDGDRYAVLATPRGDGLAWVTVWDTTPDAADFYEAMRSVIENRFGRPPVTSPSAQSVRYAARGRTLSLWGGTVDGRQMVLYTDVPQGANPTPIDVRQVRLAP